MSMALALVNFVLTGLCFIGLGLSIYALHVESQSHADNYVALCDIDEGMSCSRVFNSEYGKGFGLVSKIFGEDSRLNCPNSIFGIFSYSLLAILAQSNAILFTRLSLFMFVLSNLLTIYLVYILYFILHDFCIVCVSMYVLNCACLLITWHKLKLLRGDEDKEKDGIKVKEKDN